jgi:glycosyltransferase involved in cell wall biosynthesis
VLQSFLGRCRRWLYLRLLPTLPRFVERRVQDVLASGALGAVLRRYASARGGRRLLFVTNDLSRSGAPQLVLQMAMLELDAGNRPIVLSPLAGPMMTDMEHAGIPVLIRARPHVWDRMIPQLTPIIDAAICNTVDTADAVRLLAQLRPTLWYLHEISLLNERREQPAVREALRTAQKVWAGSPACAELIEADRSDVAVVPYGLSALPRRAREKGGRFRVGVFGSIERRKGQDLVLDAAPLLSEATRGSIHIAFYGRALDPALGERVALCACGDLFSYHGELDRDGYVNEMNAVDAVLVSSRDDTLPLVSLDALALGRMLLLTPAVGTRAWLTDGDDCLIGTQTSAAGIAHLIERALALSGESDRFADAAMASFNRHFSLARFSYRLEQALVEIQDEASL